MKTLGLLLLFLLAPGLALPQEDGPAGQSKQEIASILQELAEISKLPVKRPVARSSMSREQLRAFFQSRLDQELKPEKIRAEAVTLERFGFIPPGYDLKAATVSLMTEQAAAFYDYKKKQMVMVDGTPDLSQRFILVHELAHALADQSFSLQKFIGEPRTDDAATARLAVMEGQAQWLMYEAMGRKMGNSLRGNPETARMMVRMNEAGMSAFPELSNAPVYIRRSLLFPYQFGFLFQQAVIDKYGDRGFAEVFTRPPATSQQILHPEVYFAETPVVSVKLPEPAERKGLKKLSDGDLGEFDLAILLELFGEESDSGFAAGWRGGHYTVWQQEKNRDRGQLQFGFAFASAGQAEEFAKRYVTRMLPSKWGAFAAAEARTTAEGKVWAGQGPKGGYRIQTAGERVIIQEGDDLK